MCVINEETVRRRACLCACVPVPAVGAPVGALSTTIGGLFPSARDVRTEISGSARTRSPTCQAAAPDPNKVEMVMTLFMCKQRRAVGFFNDCTCRQDATARIDVRSA